MGDFESTEEAFCCPDLRVTTWALCIDPSFAKLIRGSWFAKVVVMSGRFMEQIMYRRLGRTAEAWSSYEKALALTQQEPERQFLQERIRQLKSKKTRRPGRHVEFRSG